MIEASAQNQLEPGIKGWLLAFLLWIGIVSPLFNLGLGVWFAINVDQTDVPAGLGLVFWLVMILRVGSRVAAALTMYFRRIPSSVWVSLGVLWFSGPILILASWTTVGGEINIGGFVRSTLIALAWTLFLIRSQRVKLTYRYRAEA